VGGTRPDGMISQRKMRGKRTRKGLPCAWHVKKPPSGGHVKACHNAHDKQLKIELPPQCHLFLTLFASSVLLSLSHLLVLLPLFSSVLPMLLALLFVWLEVHVQFQYVWPFGPQVDKGE
jgi:hypothetical protein